MVGLSEEDARTALEAAGFNVEASYQLADDGFGNVIACSLTAGERVDPSAGATITVAAQRMVPQVVGQDKDAARQALLDARRPERGLYLRQLRRSRRHRRGR